MNCFNETTVSKQYHVLIISERCGFEVNRKQLWKYHIKYREMHLTMNKRKLCVAAQNARLQNKKACHPKKLHSTKMCFSCTPSALHPDPFWALFQVIPRHEDASETLRNIPEVSHRPREFRATPLSNPLPTTHLSNQSARRLGPGGHLAREASVGKVNLTFEMMDTVDGTFWFALLATGRPYRDDDPWHTRRDPVWRKSTKVWWPRDILDMGWLVERNFVMNQEMESSVSSGATQH